MERKELRQEKRTEGGVRRRRLLSGLPLDPRQKVQGGAFLLSDHNGAVEAFQTPNFLGSGFNLDALGTETKHALCAPSHALQHKSVLTLEQINPPARAPKTIRKATLMAASGSLREAAVWSPAARQVDRFLVIFGSRPLGCSSSLELSSTTNFHHATLKPESFDIQCATIQMLYTCVQNDD